MTLNLPLLYVLWLEEYCMISPNKNKSPNLWHVTSILVCCIFGRKPQAEFIEDTELLVLSSVSDYSRINLLLKILSLIVFIYFSVSYERKNTQIISLYVQFTKHFQCIWCSLYISAHNFISKALIRMYIQSMVVWAVKISIGGYKIRHIFAKESTHWKEINKFWEMG